MAVFRRAWANAGGSGPHPGGPHPRLSACPGSTKAHELGQRTVRKVIEQARRAGVAEKDVYGLLDLDAGVWAAHPAVRALQMHDALLARALREAVILRCLLRSEWERVHGHLEWLRGRLYSRMPNALIKHWRGSARLLRWVPRTSVGAKVRAAQSAAWEATFILLRDTIPDLPPACGQPLS